MISAPCSTSNNPFVRCSGMRLAKLKDASQMEYPPMMFPPKTESRNPGKETGS